MMPAPPVDTLAHAWGIGVPQLRAPAVAVWSRALPAPGQVRVNPGDTVEAETIVAACSLPARPVFVPLLGLSPLVRPGEWVTSGQVLAQRRRWLGGPTEVRAPVAGLARDPVEGQLLLVPQPLEMELVAQLPGLVASTTPDWGVEIRGTYGLLYGTGGSGEDQYGRLGEQIAIYTDPVSSATAEAARAQGVRAIVAPSLTGSLPPGLTCLLTERGGGSMATPLAEMLLAHLGQAAALRLAPVPVLGFTGQAHASAPKRAEPEPGNWVRSADGRVGRLQQALSGRRPFASGVQATPAEVDFGDAVAVLALESLEWVA